MHRQPLPGRRFPSVRPLMLQSAAAPGIAARPFCRAHPSHVSKSLRTQFAPALSLSSAGLVAAGMDKGATRAFCRTRGGQGGFRSNEAHALKGQERFNGHAREPCRRHGHLGSQPWSRSNGAWLRAIVPPRRQHFWPLLLLSLIPRFSLGQRLRDGVFGRQAKACSTFQTPFSAHAETDAFAADRSIRGSGPAAGSRVPAALTIPGSTKPKTCKTCPRAG